MAPPVKCHECPNGPVIKTYTTSNKFFTIPQDDFDTIDAIYVSPGATGRFGLHIGNNGVITKWNQSST